MSKKKPSKKPHSKKHVVTHHRGKPVAAKKARRAGGPGRPRLYAVDQSHRTMVRSSEVEAGQWARAAEAESKVLGLTGGSVLTVGPWLALLATRRSAELIKPEPATAAPEIAQPPMVAQTVEPVKVEEQPAETATAQPDIEQSTMIAQTVEPVKEPEQVSPAAPTKLVRAPFSGDGTPEPQLDP